jgi:single-strand DNA-binding protein
MIIVSGRLQVRSWNDKEGNKRKTAEIVVDSAYFGDSKTSAPAPASQFAMLDDNDDVLPF